MTSGAIGLEFHQIGAAIPNLADDRSTLIFDPGSRASQRMHQAPEVSLPSTNFRVEIVLPIPFGVLKAVFRWLRTLLFESAKGLQDANQAAHQDISRKAF